MISRKTATKLIGMIIVGVSAGIFQYIGFWFLIPWCIGWFIYDLNTQMEA